jgi:hypothetical protein
MIPNALQGLMAYRQFIVYRRDLSKTRPGKTDKISCDYRTENIASAHNPAIWLDANTALQTVTAWGNGLHWLIYVTIVPCT